MNANLLWVLAAVRDKSGKQLMPQSSVGLPQKAPNINLLLRADFVIAFAPLQLE